MRRDFNTLGMFNRALRRSMARADRRTTVVKAMLQLFLWCGLFGWAYSGPESTLAVQQAARSGDVSESSPTADAKANATAQIEAMARYARQETLVQRTRHIANLKTFSQLLMHVCARVERCWRGFLSIADHPGIEDGEIHMTLFAPSDAAFLELQNLPGGDLMSLLIDKRSPDILVRYAPLHKAAQSSAIRNIIACACVCVRVCACARARARVCVCRLVCSSTT
jgi:hypothetical protein